MELLTKRNYNNSLDYPAILKELKSGSSIIYIEDFPLDENQLVSFIDQLGEPVNEKRNNNGLSVFDVKISRYNNFFESFANSNLDFPLHTDCADFDSIPNCIALLCVKPAGENQGINNFTLLDTVLSELTENRKQELLNKKWGFKNQSRSILTCNNGSYSISYDRITMESFYELNETEMEELDKLDNLFKRKSFQIKLRQGDLVLFRNDLVLHGRGEMDIDSKRLIKRIRFNIS